MEAGDESAEPPETTAAPVTREAPEAVLLSLTWDGEACTYEGPTELSAGLVELVFSNESEIAGYVNFLELTEGMTIEDAYNRNPWPVAGMHAPTWTRELNTWGPIPTGVTRSWVRDLEAASYYMVCARIDPVLAVWWDRHLEADQQNR